MSKPTQKTYRKGQKITNEQIIVAGIFILVLGFFVGTMVAEGGARKKRINPVREIFSTQALEIASDFSCSCGSCGEKNLAVCVCETALVEKRFIANGLNAGKAPEQVIQEMIKIYGFHIDG